MTALTLAVAVIIVAAGAIVQFRTAAMTNESADSGADADASTPWPWTPPIDQNAELAARAPSTATGPAAQFQIRPAAVQADSAENHPASTGPEQGTPLSPAPTSPAPMSPAPMSPVPTSPIVTATESTEHPPQSADQPAQPAVVGAAEAPTQKPAAPAPVAVAETPPPQAPPPDPAPAPTPQPTTAPPPSPTPAPEATPTRGKSAAHLPEHANGGVGNPDRPAPTNPGSGPKD